jgi:hypothetical protein
MLYYSRIQSDGINPLESNNLQDNSTGTCKNSDKYFFNEKNAFSPYLESSACRNIIRDEQTSVKLHVPLCMFQKSVSFKWVHTKMLLSVSFLVSPYKSVSSFHFWWHKFDIFTIALLGYYSTNVYVVGARCRGHEVLPMSVRPVLCFCMLNFLNKD